MPPRPTVSEAQHVLIDKLRKPVHHPSYAENKVNAPGPQDPFEGALEPTLFVDGFEGQELPRKRILTQRHLDHFKHSKVYAEIVLTVDSPEVVQPTLVQVHLAELVP